MTTGREMRNPSVSELKNAEARSHWTMLVREKLVPLRLLLPMREGVHEWSPIFRDLLFDLAHFLQRQSEQDMRELAREFRREHRRELLRSISDEELALLLLKARDYELAKAA